MDGSRHEKAALVSVAYLIGALTIFIGSAAQNSPYAGSVETHSFIPTTQTAAVVSAVPVGTVGSRIPQSVIPAGSSISYQAGVLAYETPAGRKILSFNPEVSGIQSSPEFEKQGAHTGDMVFAVSPEDTYVFFCEGKVDPLQCVPFVFDSRSQMIYPVTQNTESQPLSRATAASIGWVDGQLSLPGFTSVTAEKPWLLLGQN